MDEQYLNLLREIKEKGTWKPAAREGMPSTLSLFGHQMKFDLSSGKFPLLTTKKMFWKGIVVELLWFLRGDTNIKYLVDNGSNFWNEDAYNYYCKVFKQKYPEYEQNMFTFDEFIQTIKERTGLERDFQLLKGYTLGDCGHQYGKLWRAWDVGISVEDFYDNLNAYQVDQVKELIDGLKKNPMGRRHIITAWNPATLDKMALNACHALVQFNCRPIIYRNTNKVLIEYDLRSSEVESKVKELNLPKYYLDCQLYQRSADVFLGVPFNIASYALLTHILAKICNMVPGDFVHTFGDVHIYENHMDAVNEQLTREPRELPKLHLADAYNNIASTVTSWDDIIDPEKTHLFRGAFLLENYNPHPSIKAELSTGLKK